MLVQQDEESSGQGKAVFITSSHLQDTFCNKTAIFTLEIQYFWKRANLQCSANTSQRELNYSTEAYKWNAHNFTFSSSFCIQRSSVGNPSGCAGEKMPRKSKVSVQAYTLQNIKLSLQYWVWQLDLGIVHHPNWYGIKIFYRSYSDRSCVMRTHKKGTWYVLLPARIVFNPNRSYNTLLFEKKLWCVSLHSCFIHYSEVDEIYLYVLHLCYIQGNSVWHFYPAYWQLISESQMTYRRSWLCIHLRHGRNKMAMCGVGLSAAKCVYCAQMKPLTQICISHTSL